MANATQFNYRLSDGTIILADVNPTQAATVDVAPILSGKIASPAPQEILQRERDLQARGTTATTFNPNTSVAERDTINTSAGITTSQAGIKTDPALFATPENVKNALATPQQIAEQMKSPNWNAGNSPITPQSIEEGIKNLVLTPQQQKDYFASQGNSATPLSPTAWAKGNSNPVITTDSSKGESPIKIASSTSNTNLADSTVAGADTTAKGIQDYIKLLTPPESDASTGVKNLINSITSDLEGLKGRGATQLSEEEAQGVNAKKQILQNAQTELNQKLAEYKSIQAKYQQLNASVEGKAITMGSIVGSQAQVNKAMQAELNVKSSEIAMIQANVAGAQGNLKLAQDSADRAVDLKYEDTKDAIDIRLKQLELMEGNLEKEEKTRSDAIALYLNDQKTKLATQVANEKDKNATLLNLFQKYSDVQGFNLATDTLESLGQKIKATSAIYKKETQVSTSSDLSGAPNSYKEWTLAGSPGTYADWLKEQGVKAPTIAQQTVAEYAARIEQANPIIEKLEPTINGMNVLSFEAQLRMNPSLQSAEIQQYKQAASNFINAKLRRESGAVISPSEFTEARSQYLPVPGDKAETLKQKKANRDLVYASLKKAAGNAYASVDELFSKSGTQTTQPQTIEYPLGSGKRYSVDAQGNMTPL